MGPGGAGPWAGGGGAAAAAASRVERVPGVQHYKTLGVAQSATPKQITDAFRAAARTQHSDRGAKGDAGMQALTAARDVLLDPRRRAAYDAAGDDGVRLLEEGAPLDSIVGSSAAEGGGGEGSYLSGAAGAAGAASEADVESVAAIEVQVQVTLDEVMRGTTRTVTVHRRSAGAAVDASGEAAAVTVSIPAGVVPGSRLLAFEGHAMRDGRRGPVIVHVRDAALVPADAAAGMKRNGCDLVMRAVVPLWKGVVGGPVAVDRVPGQGTVYIDLPPMTLRNVVLEVPGLGFPMFGDEAGRRGSLAVVVEVVLPTPDAVSAPDRREAALLLGAPVQDLVVAETIRAAGDVHVHTPRAMDEPARQARLHDVQQRAQDANDEAARAVHAVTGGGRHPGYGHPGGGHAGGAGVQNVQCVQQ
jgi:DnaJ-class molecular chaperone